MSQIVSHILVKHKYEADDILAQIKSGKLFADLAKKFSTCSSASAGGKLGDLEKIGPRLDEDFLEATVSLPINEVSQPVRTKFGYHLILVE